MHEYSMVLSPLGDSALMITLGDEMDDAMTTRVASVAEALRQSRLPGVVEIVGVFATVAVYYDIAHTGPYLAFESRVTDVARRAAESSLRSAVVRTVEIPVCYGGEYGPDLEEVAGRARVSLNEVIESHSKAEYRVHAIGFVPGFAYLGGLPKSLHTPRRDTPRRRVPAGSVGIGGAQTGVYPLETPGGWNLIGRTPLVMFDPGRREPALVRAGDRVKFRVITPEEFIAWK